MEKTSVALRANQHFFHFWIALWSQRTAAGVIQGPSGLGVGWQKQWFQPHLGQEGMVVHPAEARQVAGRSSRCMVHFEVLCTSPLPEVLLNTMSLLLSKVE